MSESYYGLYFLLISLFSDVSTPSIEYYLVTAYQSVFVYAELIS